MLAVEANSNASHANLHQSRRKVAIVTGSTRGIGRSIADTLWDDGYLVIYSGRSDRPTDIPDDRSYIPCDVSDTVQCDRLISITIELYSRLDVFVSNAGVAPEQRMDVMDTTPESYDRVMNINLRGAFFIAQHAAKVQLSLIKDGLADYTPRIVFITSISAYAVSTNRAEYCISKAGLAMAARLLAARLAPEGIRVFEIRPGIIETDMTAGVKAKYDALIASGLTPIPRIGQPSDVAKMVQAICSGLLDFTAGQVLDADGGFHITRL